MWNDPKSKTIWILSWCHKQEINMVSHSKNLGTLKSVYTLSTLCIQGLWNMTGFCFQMWVPSPNTCPFPNPQSKIPLAWNILDQGQSTGYTFHHSFLTASAESTRLYWKRHGRGNWTTSTSPACFSIASQDKQADTISTGHGTSITKVDCPSNNIPGRRRPSVAANV